MPKHVLVVDDEACMRLLLSEGLRRAGFHVTTANGVRDALSILTNSVDASAPVDLLLTDFSMPGLTGLELIDALKREGKEMPCVLMSGERGGFLAFEALSRGCAAFIEKPFRLPVLVEYIREALGVEPEQAAALHWAT